jgi:hypothetical protein
MDDRTVKANLGHRAEGKKTKSADEYQLSGDGREGPYKVGSKIVSCVVGKTPLNVRA